MDSAIASCNKFLEKKWNDLNYLNYLQKIKKVKPYVDARNKKEETYKALLNNASKRKHNKHEKLTSIDRENLRILKQISNKVFRKNPLVSYKNIEPRSLIETQRKRQWFQNDYENRQLVRRFDSAKATPQVKELNKRIEKYEGYLSHITEFPYIIRPLSFSKNYGKNSSIPN